MQILLILYFLSQNPSARPQYSTASVIVQVDNLRTWVYNHDRKWLRSNEPVEPQERAPRCLSIIGHHSGKRILCIDTVL